MTDADMGIMKNVTYFLAPSKACVIVIENWMSSFDYDSYFFIQIKEGEGDLLNSTVKHNITRFF